MTKFCNKCGQELDESRFSRDSNSKDGLQGYCRDCKKQHNKQYNDSKMNPTVYFIENVVTSRTYVGATNYPHQRPMLHKSRLKFLRHPSKLMQEDYNLYGFDSFVFRVLEDNVPEDKLMDIETNWIQDLQPAYNTRKVSA